MTTALTIFTSVITLATIVFVIKYSMLPGTANRSIEQLAASLGMLGMPAVILLIMSATQGKWQAVLFLTTMISIFVAGTLIGYFGARYLQKDAFEYAFVTGCLVSGLAGGPMASYMLP